MIYQEPYKPSATIQDYVNEYSELYIEYQNTVQDLTQRITDLSDKLSMKRFPSTEVLIDFPVDKSEVFNEDDVIMTKLTTMVGTMEVYGDLKDIKGLHIMIYKEE